jgi:hypothetical protein
MLLACCHTLEEQVATVMIGDEHQQLEAINDEEGSFTIIQGKACQLAVGLLSGPPASRDHIFVTALYKDWARVQ